MKTKTSAFLLNYGRCKHHCRKIRWKDKNITVPESKRRYRFFYVERILPNENGYVKATVSRQQIEDAVSTVIVILPITAFLCTLISILSALAYSHMLTKPIKQISSATKQMQELTSDVHCEIHTHDEMEAVVR